MFSRVHVIGYLCFWLVLSPVWCGAEPERGRLPDGRAYRTGAEGVQMVDYVAELEISLDELTRRVHSLEDELEEKRQRIERLESRGAMESVLKERDLLKGTGEASGCAVCPVCDCTQRGTQAINSLEAVQSQPRCISELEATRHELAETRQDLGDARVRISALEQRLRQVPSAELSAQKSAEAQMVQLRMALEARISQLEAEKKELHKRLEDQNLRLSEAGGKRLTVTRASDKAAQAEPRAAYSVVALRSASSYGTSVAQPERLAIARTRAVNSFKASLHSSLNQLSGLIAERDNKFKEYGPQTGPLRFKPSALVSSRRYTLAMIKRGVAEAQSMSQLSALDRDIKEIRALLRDDIKLIDRMRQRRS